MKYNTHILKLNNRQQIIKEMQKIGADPAGIHIMTPKAEHYIIKAQHLSLKALNLLKQEMLSKGADAVLHKGVSMLRQEASDVLLIGTRKQLKEVAKKLKVQPFDLHTLGEEIEEVLEPFPHKESTTLYANGKEITLGSKTLIMGILNVTPDSFSDGGKFNHIQAAVEHAKQMIADGADMIDVGGESTRPGHTSVSLEEELERVIPIIKELSKQVDVPLSIDTYKAEVAKQAIEAGAHIINDVWGFKKDTEMAQVAAKLDVPVILMHNRENGQYNELIDDMIQDLRESVSIATKGGVRKENIILDPGIGFAKTHKENLLVMNRLDEITSLGYPVLLGTSRKSIVGKTLDLPVEQRVEGTAATIAMGIIKGSQIIRVHDVKEMARVAKMMDAMVEVNEGEEGV